MARLALHLPIFIASPNDAHDERDIIEQVVENRVRRAANHDVFLSTVRWERDARPTVGRPQAFINRLLEKCELTVVIFREREGSPAGGPNGDTGAWEELTLAMELVRAGKLDDVFLYYYEVPNSKPVATPLRDRLERLFKSHRIFAYSYASLEDLLGKFGSHIDHWLDTWEQIPKIASFTLEQVAPTRLPATQTGQSRLAVIQPQLAHLSPNIIEQLGQLAVAAYQKLGPENGLQAPLFSAALPSDIAAQARELPGQYLPMRKFGLIGLHPFPLAKAGSNVVWSDEEWFYVFCALGLRDCICKRDYTAVERYPYINPVHQLLPACAHGERELIIQVLTEWLDSVPPIVATKPIVRNFAAYVLGMLGALEAQDALAHACETDRGQDVALYSVTSLGKIRSRRYLDLLVDQFARVSDPHLRLTLGQAICRIIGIAEYEL